MLNLIDFGCKNFEHNIRRGNIQIFVFLRAISITQKKYYLTFIPSALNKVLHL